MFFKLSIYVVHYKIFSELTKVHVYELKIISDHVLSFLCLFFVLFLMKMLIVVSLTPSSIHLLAFLHFSFSAVWVLCFCVLHRHVPAPLCFYMVCIPRRIWLRPRGTAVS